MACSKLGAVALYLNTAFAGPQLADVMEREEPKALIYDQEFTELLSDVKGGLRRYVAWEDEVDEVDETTVEELISSAARRRPRGALRARPLHHPHLRHDRNPEGRPAQPARGPGRPRGAVLEDPAALRRDGDDRRAPLPLLGLPALHAQPADRRRRWSCGRSFDPEDTLRAIAEHRARVLAVVPVMMQRILALPDEVKRRYDLSSLEVTAASGSALPGELATKWMDEFGDNLYNLYGSTEVAWATIATPEDMRAAPGTAGRPPRGHGDPDRRRGRQRRRRRARPGGSSSATSSPSRATRAAATRSTSATCSPPATSATSTRTAASSSTGGTTR